MKSLKQLCIPRESVFAAKRRDAVLTLMHLAEDRIDGDAFIDENWVTSGMHRC